jgi:hypothetical protein
MMIEVSLKHNFCLIEPQGPLSRADFETIAKQIDPVIEKGGQLDGLIIRTRDFPGWKSFGDFVEHCRFVKNHHRVIDRIALVTDTPVAQIFPLIVSHFVSAEVKQFDFDDYDEAVVWMQSTGPQD